MLEQRHVLPLVNRMYSRGSAKYLRLPSWRSGETWDWFDAAGAALAVSSAPTTPRTAATMTGQQNNSRLFHDYNGCIAALSASILVLKSSWLWVSKLCCWRPTHPDRCCLCIHSQSPRARPQIIPRSPPCPVAVESVMASVEGPCTAPAVSPTPARTPADDVQRPKELKTNPYIARTCCGSRSRAARRL